jgi:hypothetical protein
LEQKNEFREDNLEFQSKNQQHRSISEVLLRNVGWKIVELRENFQKKNLNLKKN